MNNSLRHLLFFLFFPFLLQSQPISWQQLSGPHGGNIYSLVADNDGNLYASPTGTAGPFKSTDNGETWFSIKNGLSFDENGEWRPLNINHKGYIFIANPHDYNQYISLSTDGGNSWEEKSLSSIGSSIICIAFDDTDNVYIGTGAGIFKSTDNGDTWALFGNFTGSTNAIAFNDSGDVFVGSGVGYRSTDGGVSWTGMIANGGIGSLAINESGYIFAGNNSGIARSTDNGDHWTYVKQGVNIYEASTILIDSNGDIYFPTWGNGVLKSTDNGDTWAEMNNNLGYKVVHSVVKGSSGNFFAGNNYGLYKSTDGCESWYSVGLPVAGVSKILITKDSNIYTVEWGINRSTDFGQSWQTINNGLGNLNVTSLTVNSKGYLFAGTIDNSNGLIYRSTNNGDSWVRVDSFNSGNSMRGLAAGPNDEIAAVGGGYGYITHISNDDGLTWRDISYNLRQEFGDFRGATGVAINSAGDMFFIINAGVWRKLANDTTWTACSGSSCGSYNVLFIANNGYIYTEYTKSTDNGDTWTTNNFPTFITSYAENSLGHLFIGTSNWGQGVYRSTDYGERWEQINTGLPIMDIHSVGVDAEDYLYAGSWGLSIFKSTTSTNFHLGDPSLIAHYPFNGNPNDSSGYENNGNAIDAVLTTDRFGVENSAFEFNGSSSYISIPNSFSLQSPTTELTQNAWIYLYSWGNGGNWAPVLMKSNSGSNAFQYRLSIGTNGINTSVNNWDNSVVNMDTLEFNKWYMITSVLKDDTVKHYVNAKLIGSGTLKGPINLDKKPLEIGRDVPGSTEYFNGKIDDIKIYNRAVSESEITSLYGKVVNINSKDNIGRPIVFRLEQNYPNPFNPTTKIKYSIPKHSKVVLKIYDVLGKEIETLVNEEKPAGVYEINWNAAKLSSGVYFYRLNAGEYISTKKMILIK